MSGQIESLRRFMGPRTGQASAPRNVVVFAGGKGGVGTSTVTALVGVGLARRGARVLLVDGSQGWLHMLFGVRDVPGLASLRGGAVAPEELVVPLRDGLDLLPSALGDEALLLDAGPMERRALIRRVGSLYPRYDAVMIDAGSRLRPILEACDLGADRVVVVTTGERPAVASAYALLKGVHLRLPELARTVLVNRSTTENARTVFHCIHDAASRFGVGGIESEGSVPVDGRLVVGLDDSPPIHQTPPDSPAAHATMEIAARLHAQLETRASTRARSDRWLQGTHS